MTPCFVFASQTDELTRPALRIWDADACTGDTFCFSGGSGGPNEDDCAVIADAILYDSQNVGAIFNATAPGTATDKVTMQYKSCLTYFLNQDSANETLSYCRSDWVSPSPSPCSACPLLINERGASILPHHD